MNFENIKWEENDFNVFRKYLKSLKNTEEKVKRRITIINTKMPVLAIYSKEVKMISDSIYKESDYFNYLNNDKLYFYEETMIYGNILSKLNDFDLFEKYLNSLSLITDNWATVDNIKFDKMYKIDKERLYKLALSYLNSDLEFQRRYGILILFKYINDSSYNLEIFKELDKLIKEDAYYVNIASAWLLCEMFIKQREITLNYFKINKTNKQIVNMAIQKCRDSFRVSIEDKELILKFKIK